MCASVSEPIHSSKSKHHDNENFKKRIHDTVGAALELSPIKANDGLLDLDLDQTTRQRVPSAPSSRPKRFVIADQYRIGRVQRQLLRATIAADGKPLGISDLSEWCYPTTQQHPR